MSTQSDGVTIRSPRPDDIKARMSLGVSAEIVRMYGAIRKSQSTMSRQDATAWLERMQAHPCAWVIDVDQSLVGEVRLDNIHETDRRARLAIGLFNERFVGRKIGRSAIKQVLRHAFDTMGLHRVDLRVLSYNLRAIRCYEACGFVHEGIERQSARVGDEWHDDWIMGILEQDFRALTSP